MRRYLASLFVILAACSTTSINPPHAPEESSCCDIDTLTKEATQLLADFLHIRTDNPPGNETTAAEFVRAFLARNGIPSDIYEYAPGRGSLYARLKGSGQKRPVIMLSHLDVVPVQPEAWTVDPWGGIVQDEKLWGRGALDMKGQTIVQAVTMVALKRRNVGLSRDIILLANADEENNGTGARYMIREKAALFKDAEYLLNEGGGNRVGPDGKTMYYGIGVGEKMPFPIRVVAHGTSGHASRPGPDNPVGHLVTALSKVVRYETPIRIIPPIDSFFRNLSQVEMDSERQKWLAAPAEALQTDAGRRFFLSDPAYNALLRDTISLTVLKGSPKVNVIPSEASAEIDIRLLPGSNPDTILNTLHTVIGDHTIAIEPIHEKRTANGSPAEGELIEAVKSTVAKLDPGSVVTP